MGRKDNHREIGNNVEQYVYENTQTTMLFLFSNTNFALERGIARFLNICIPTSRVKSRRRISTLKKFWKNQNKDQKVILVHLIFFVGVALGSIVFDLFQWLPVNGSRAVGLSVCYLILSSSMVEILNHLE